MRLRAIFGLISKYSEIRTYGFSICFLLVDPRFVPISLSSPIGESKMSKSALVASGGGHTLEINCDDTISISDAVKD